MSLLLGWARHTCLLVVLFLAAECYDFKNYTRNEMQELARLQEQFMNQPRAVVGDVGGECSCNLAWDDISCGCCTRFRLFSSRHEACAKAGISMKELAIILSFTFNGYGPTIKIQPEICIRLPFPLFLIRICLGVYHADFCIDKDNASKSTFKICLQADLVILIPVFTVDFNCLVFSNGKLDVDDSIHTDRPGIITYKIGKGVSFNNPFRAVGEEEDDFTLITVGQEAKRLGILGKKKKVDPLMDSLVCEQISDLKKVCKPPKMDMNSTWF